MAKINVLSNTDLNMPACSGVIHIFFRSTEPVQFVKFYKNNEIDETHKTFIYLDAEYVTYEYRYSYHVVYSYSLNRTTKPIVWSWKLDVFFDNDLIPINGTVTLRNLDKASYIIVNSVTDKNGNLLTKDIWNRYIIGADFHEGDLFFINFLSSYPAYLSEIPLANDAGGRGSYFIEEVYSISTTLAGFTINNVFTNTETLNILLDFDDSWGIGPATTFVSFTRDNKLPVYLSTEPDSFQNLTYNAGEYKFDLYFENIDFDNIIGLPDVDWISIKTVQTTDVNKAEIIFTTTKNSDDETRQGTIKIQGTNTLGVYATTLVPISLIPESLPYFGDFSEVEEISEGVFAPVIRTDYKGNINANTKEFIIYNVLNGLGEYQINDVEILMDGEETDYLKYVYVEGEETAKLITKDKYDYNYVSEIIRKYIDVIIYTDSGTNIQTLFVVLQEASPKRIYAPIWKDIYFECQKQYFRFRNIDNGDLLYNGMIYSDASNVIQINKILESFINLTKDIFDTDITKNNVSINAILETSTTADFAFFSEDAIYQLYWNYSYDYNAPDKLMGDYTPGYYGLHSGIDIDGNFANPIDYYDPRQVVFINWSQEFTKFNNAGYVYADNEQILEIPKNTFIGDILTISVLPGMSDEISLSIMANEGEDYDHGYTWYCGKGKCTNANYAVYYMNSYGMWCWMLFEGKQLESLKVTPNKYLTQTPNNISHNIHTAIYQNNVEEYFELTSIYLKDELSKKLRDLYTSPLIYVHDLVEDVIYNVYLNTTTYNVKTYKNLGRKRYTHTIKLTKSLTKNIIM